MYQSPFCPLLLINYFKKSNVPQHWIGGVFFARGISPCQKWRPSLLGREISCSQWEGRSMHSRCLAFFPFMFWGGGGGQAERDFFSFFLASQCVRTIFLSSSQWVPNISPTFSPYLLTFIPYALENGVLLSPIYLGQRGGTVQFKIEPSVLGSLHCFSFLEWWANQIGTSPKITKTKELGRHLI